MGMATITSGLCSAEETAPDRQSLLLELRATIEAVCGEFDKGGVGSVVEGRVKGEIDTLVSRLTGAGIEVDGSYKERDYYDFNRDDIPGYLSDVRKCNQEIYRDFAPLILGGSVPKGRFHYVIDLNPPDEWLALRGAPSTSYGGRRAKLAEGTKMVVLRKEGVWRKVQVADGRIGWVHAAYIACCTH